MKNSNILLITENSAVWKNLQEKLMLVRTGDKIKIIDFAQAFSALETEKPSIIFICLEEKSAILKIIEFVKENLPNSILILGVENYNTDFIISMYDAGAADYVLKDSKPADILIKTVNALKVVSERESALINKKLLEDLDGISAEDGFYTEKFANELMDNLLNTGMPSSFLIVTYDELDRAMFDFEKLSDSIRSSIRNRDIVVKLRNGKFYILLEDTEIKGAEIVFEKIKKTLNGAFRIKAGLCEVSGKSFQELEQKTTVALTDAMLGANDYVIYQEKALLEEEDWTLEPENTQKDFKLFKQLFVKKMENVITPVFYKLQNTYDGTLSDTKIEQYTDENRCIFHLRSPKQTSRLTIVYPGFAKVVIYITHSGLDSPENKEYSIPLKDLTELLLTALTEDFIKDYKSCIDS
ncbi:hypothetical protein DBY21_01855 [Candidatus Gastranaerophilales bacterium]|nr:MAG: hypothetical protein DBY21_06225 [Candidatus Gastranaerophilales bacterium]PWL80387.1 MAG: hypothetical protein DBY21_01855 [Candidatus Gastranaerophilales bacterium]